MVASMSSKKGPGPGFHPRDPHPPGQRDPHPLQAVRRDCLEAQLRQCTAGRRAVGGRRGGAAPSNHDQIGLFWVVRNQRSEGRGKGFQDLDSPYLAWGAPGSRS